VCAFDLANCGNISLVPYPLITISELTVANHHSITSLHVPYGFASSYIKSIHLRNEINLIVLLLLSVFIFLITLFFIYISLFHFVYGERLWKGEKGDELYYFFRNIRVERGWGLEVITVSLNPCCHYNPASIQCLCLYTGWPQRISVHGITLSENMVSRNIW